MAINRKFLDWDTPVSDTVTEYLIGDLENGNLDLSDTLIIVPTSRAGRRLKEQLAAVLEETGSAVIGGRVTTPSSLFAPRHVSIATDTDLAAAWLKILKSMDDTNLAALCPTGLNTNNTDELLALADNIDTIRKDLSDNLLTINSVLSESAETLVEYERWTALAELETRLFKELAVSNLEDPVSAKINEAKAPSAADEFDSVLVCCAPGISGIAANTLEKIALEKEVTVLIHAPKTLADSFDICGRPIPQKWAERSIDIPDWKNNLYIETTPVSQAARTIALINENRKKFGPLDTAIGVPDHDAVACIQDEFEKYGISTHDPREVQMTEIAVFKLILYISTLCEQDDYRNLALVLRHPDFLKCMDSDEDFNIRDMLSELDDFYTSHFPGSLATIKEYMSHREKRYSSTSLCKAVNQADGILETIKNSPFAAAWRTVLGLVYKYKRLSSKDVFDISFSGAADEIDKVLTELTPYQDEFSTGTLNTMLISRLRERAIPRNREGALIDLDGWLELHWNNAPLMIITGMNEDFVPGVKVSDIFMPNTLRKQLGILDDDTVFARDSYLLSAIMESRREDGRVCLMAGKFASNNSPLKPSRLLFKCRDNDFVDVAARLFSEPAELISKPPSALPFKFKLDRLTTRNDMLKSKRISVTAFSSYLACPFRFYLNYIAGLAETSDTEMGVDAMLFGTMIHDVLEKMGKDPDMNSCTDPTELHKGLTRTADQVFFRQFGKSFSGFIGIAYESALERLRAVANVQAGLAAEGWTVLADELEVKHTLKLAGFTVSGKIDRVDYHPDLKTLRIMDYKTGSIDMRKDSFQYHVKKAPKDHDDDYRLFSAGGKNWLWQDLQLPLYYHMVADGPLTEKYPIDYIELGHFVIPKAVSGTRIMTWKGSEGDNRETLDNALDCAKTVIEKIKAQEFWPPAESVQYDDFEALFIDGPEGIEK